MSFFCVIEAKPMLKTTHVYAIINPLEQNMIKVQDNVIMANMLKEIVEKFMLE